MTTVAYALREAYAGTVEQELDGQTVEVPRFLGGLIAVDDARDFDVRAELDAGDGIIVVDETDAALIRVLDAYPPLKHVAAPADAEPSSSKYEGIGVTQLRAELRRRELETSGTRDELVARLEANDQAVAAGDQERAASPTPEAPEGDAGDNPDTTPEA